MGINTTPSFLNRGKMPQHPQQIVKAPMGVPQMGGIDTGPSNGGNFAPPVRAIRPFGMQAPQPSQQDNSQLAGLFGNFNRLRSY